MSVCANNAGVGILGVGTPYLLILAGWRLVPIRSPGRRGGLRLLRLTTVPVILEVGT